MIVFEHAVSVAEELQSDFDLAAERSTEKMIASDVKTYLRTKVGIDISGCLFTAEFVECDSGNPSHASAYYLIKVGSTQKKKLAAIILGLEEDPAEIEIEEAQ